MLAKMCPSPDGYFLCSGQYTDTMFWIFGRKFSKSQRGERGADSPNDFPIEDTHLSYEKRWSFTYDRPSLQKALGTCSSFER